MDITHSFNESGDLVVNVPKEIFNSPEKPPADSGYTVISVEDYGAIPNDVTKATANRIAIQKAIDENNYILFPNKYYIDTSLTTTSYKYLIGFGMRTSGLIGIAGMNAPLLKFEDGFNAKLCDMELSYNDWAPQDKRNAILFLGQIAHSTFKNLRFISVTRAIYIDPTSTIGGNVFSNNFENLYTFWYSRNAYHLKARSGANTGNVFSNLYSNNGLRDNRFSGTVTPFYFEELSESTMIQLNAEWSNVDSAFHFKYCRNITLLSAHIEGVNMKTSNRGLIRVEGISGSPTQKGSLRVLGLDLYGIACDVPGYVFQAINNGVLYAHDMNEQVTEGNLKLLHTSSSGEDYVYLENIRALNFSSIEPNVPLNANGKPKLMRYNDENRYLVVKSNGSNYRITVENGVLKATKI